jgi:hypothetical protein
VSTVSEVKSMVPDNSTVSRNATRTEKAASVMADAAITRGRNEIGEELGTT